MAALAQEITAEIDQEILASLRSLATTGETYNQAAVSGGGLDFEKDNSDHYDLVSTITIAENGGFCLAVVVDQETVTDNMILSKDSNDHIKIADANTFRIIANDDTQTTTNFKFDSHLLRDWWMLLGIPTRHRHHVAV